MGARGAPRGQAEGDGGAKGVRLVPRRIPALVMITMLDPCQKLGGSRDRGGRGRGSSWFHMVSGDAIGSSGNEVDCDGSKSTFSTKDGDRYWQTGMMAIRLQRCIGIIASLD